MKIDIRWFFSYKFLNSLFLGVSIGSIFTLYTPLEPSIYSIGGVVLAFFMLIIAQLYEKILTIKSFFIISLGVELVLLFAIIFFLFNSYNYQTALIIYIAYQITFIFGNYLLRAETLFLSKSVILKKVDTFKQIGYLLGMLISYLFYEYFNKETKEEQVYLLHILLVFIETTIIYTLLKSFTTKKVL